MAYGRKIAIADGLEGDIANEAGVKISKNADGELIYQVLDGGKVTDAYNTLSTAGGEQTKVRLPDGTVVFLNAESSLRYPANFGSLAIRKVDLVGEGFFEVAKDRAHPFVVESDGQKVEVLGTHFNVNAYKDNAAIKTTLLEGSVRVDGLGADQSRVLRPGQQSRVSGSGIAVALVELNDIGAWREGIFMFDNEPLEDIMKEVARWYKLEVEFSDPSLKQIPIYNTANRFEKVSVLLKPLGRIAKVDFKIKAGKIIVSKKEN